MDDRFYRVSLGKRRVVLSGTGYLAFFKRGSTGWVDPDQKTLWWQGRSFRLGLADYRILGVAVDGSSLMVENEADSRNYQVYRFLSNGAF